MLLILVLLIVYFFNVNDLHFFTDGGYIMPKKYIMIDGLVPGMIVADDVININGQLIIKKGSILTDDVISKLESARIFDIPIDDINDEYEQDSTSYYENLKDSGEFLSFKTDYLSVMNNTKETFNHVKALNGPLDVDETISGIIDLLKKGESNLHIFDMLHVMRDLNDIIYVHSVNVALISNILGQWLELPADDIKVLTAAALLHDIGKTQIPKEILTKPEKLSADEIQLLHTHTTLGYDILKDKQLDQRIKDVALMHHERCDGTGYPSHLSYQDISPFAKIVAIADVYDAMTASRSYREPMCAFKVIETFENQGLSQYDPGYILTFMENIVSIYVNTDVLLSDGREAEIVFINRQRLSRPMVRCGKDFIDLTKTPNLKIDSLI